MGKPFNLFSQPSKRPPRSKEADSKDKEMVLHPALIDKSEEKENFSLDPNTMTVSDVSYMIEKFKKMHDEIDRKLDVIYQQTGLSPDAVRTFLNNPNNFSSKDWERFQKQRKALMSTLKIKKEGSTSSKTLSDEVTTEDMEKKAALEAKDRRSKMSGARRNWIPMR